MKFCPKCQAKYDEDVIRFCTKDGSPLVDDSPSFTAMPSQTSFDNIGEETIITRNRPVVPPLPPNIIDEEEPSQRVVIPIGEEKKQTVRPLETPPHSIPPRKSNTALVVLLTLLGTFVVLGAVGLGWWLMAGKSPATANTIQTRT